MSTKLREALGALQDGQAHTSGEADWELVGELLGVDFDEYDDYDFYIVERDHPLVFVKGPLTIDGNCHTDDLAKGRPGCDVDGREWGVVVLGDLEVNGNLSLDELSPLFVAGDVKAGSITNGYGSLVVGGTIEAGFVYLITADEGGIVHTSECKTPLFIDAGGTIDSHAPGDYRTLFANGYDPREKAVLRQALEELGFDASGMTLTSEVQALGDERDPARIARFVELVGHFTGRRPDAVPEDAEWDDGSPSAYILRQTDDEGRLHGIEGQWKADGTVETIKRFSHGVPHGEWIVEHGGRLHTLVYEDGELRRPDSVPEGATWLEDEWEWQLCDTDEDGKKHGEVRWWRPDGTLVCEATYVHGLVQGEGRRFHESGEVSQTYVFVDGELHGERVLFATDEPTTEQPLGEGIAKAVYHYEMGKVVAVKFYASDGGEVDRWGKPV